MIALLCYALLALAWIVDLVTPQLFVAAILLDGPIALSTMSLRPQLTVRLIVLAEIANVIAGYVNGVQDHYHWDAIALGDRALSAASFILVGILTLQAQRSARAAGEGSERERRVERERSLRRAMERVRASLNLELVLRAATREALALAGASRAMIAVRNTSFDVPTIYAMEPGSDDVSVRKAPLSPELASIVERARESKRLVTIDRDDPLGRLLDETAAIGSLDIEGIDIALILTWPEALLRSEERALLAEFVDNLAVAVQQARLFIRLAEQNDAIARTQRELEERSSVIRDLVYALAHDLRTPLAAADLTMTQALAGAYGELPERYRAILRSSIGSNADLRRLVETLLLVARYEAGEDSHAFAPQPLAALIDRVAQELAPVARDKGVHLEITPVPKPIELDADGDELRRAITNLLANALEASPAGSTVRVLVTQSDAAVTIDVIDEGFGVPPERRSALFQRFGGVRGGAGTGLGLYIVRRIAEKYGGTARYEPREPSGSRFTIEFPSSMVHA